MSHRPNVVLPAVLVAILAVGSCAKDPEAVRKTHVARGDAYVAQKKYREAIIEYRNAVQAAPNSGTTRYKLAEAYAAVSEVQHALPEYVRAADLQPKNADAQLKAGNLLLLSRQYEEAKVRARKALEIDPNNAPALLMLGNALAGLKQFDEAVAANTRAVALDPKHVGMYLNLGTLEYLQGNTAESEAAFQKAVDLEPGNIDTHLGLANFYWFAGRAADAERSLKAAFKLQPKNLQANQLLATLYLGTGRGPEAEAHLKTTVEVAQDIPSKIGLADYYVAMGRRGAAFEILEAIAREKDGFNVAKTRMALIDYVGDRRNSAMNALDEVLARQPGNANALALKAHILLAEHGLQAAQKLAEAAVAADARSVRAHFARGKVMLAVGQLEDARKSFLQVLQLDPLAAEAHVELSKLHLSRREIDSAIQSAEQAVKSAPRFLEARLTLVRALSVRSSEQPRADAEMRMLLRSLPTSADVHMANGQLALAKEQPAAAKQAFERALQLNPTFLEALDRLVAMDVKAGRTAEARRRVDAALIRTPDAPGVLLLAGKTYAAHGDAARAERLLQRVIELDSDNLEAYTALAGFYLVQRRLPDAQREFMELTKRQPESVAPVTMVGILSEAQGHQAEAERWYQKALEINPSAAAAANNLAWLYAERGENLDTALQLAQAAHAQLPSQPEVADTLGWVYYKKELYAMAIPVLERCVQKDPANPIYKFHLGMVHAKRGEDRKARIQLEAALRLKPDFPGAVEAKRVLAKLIY